MTSEVAVGTKRDADAAISPRHAPFRPGFLGVGLAAAVAPAAFSA